MSEKKIRITKANRFEDIKALLTDQPVTYGTTIEDALKVLNHELELLANKNKSGDKKQTAVQKENEGYKTLILDFLTATDNPDGMTCTEIGKAIPALSDFNNQKIAALLTQLKRAGKVEAVTGKSGKTLFKLA